MSTNTVSNSITVSSMDMGEGEDLVLCRVCGCGLGAARRLPVCVAHEGQSMGVAYNHRGEVSGSEGEV